MKKKATNLWVQKGERSICIYTSYVCYTLPTHSNVGGICFLFLENAFIPTKIKNGGYYGYFVFLDHS